MMLGAAGLLGRAVDVERDPGNQRTVPQPKRAPFRDAGMRIDAPASKSPLSVTSASRARFTTSSDPSTTVGRLPSAARSSIRAPCGAAIAAGAAYRALSLISMAPDPGAAPSAAPNRARGRHVDERRDVVGERLDARVRPATHLGREAVVEADHRVLRVDRVTVDGDRRRKREATQNRIDQRGRSLEYAHRRQIREIAGGDGARRKRDAPEPHGDARRIEGVHVVPQLASRDRLRNVRPLGDVCDGVFGDRMIEQRRVGSRRTEEVAPVAGRGDELRGR